MDITFTSEWDAKRYGQVIGRVNRLVRCNLFPMWCLVISGVVKMLACWLGDDLTLESGFLLGLWIIVPCLSYVWFRLAVNWRVKAIERLLSGEKTSVCHLTETAYEVTCGEMSQRLPWKCMGTHYHFFDDDTLVILHKNGGTSLVLCDLSRRGIDRRELEDVLLRSDIKPVLCSRKRKVRKVVLTALGLFFLLMAGLRVSCFVEACRSSVRCWDTRVRLFDLIYGENAPDRPVTGDTCREKVVRLLAGKSRPDEFLYRYDPEEEWDKVGLYARYGDRSYEAFYPCGCACAQFPGYFEHVKSLHAPTVYLESEKEKWLAQIRPIVKDL